MFWVGYVEIEEDRILFEPEHVKEETMTIFFRDIGDAHIVFDFSPLDKNKKNATKR